MTTYHAGDWVQWKDHPKAERPFLDEVLRVDGPLLYLNDGNDHAITVGQVMAVRPAVTGRPAVVTPSPYYDWTFKAVGYWLTDIAWSGVLGVLWVGLAAVAGVRWLGHRGRRTT